MAATNTGRWTTSVQGDFVVFIIGTRPDVRHPLRWLRDVGGARGVDRMLDHLSKHDDSGLLGYQRVGLTIYVQYWRSFEHLESFANGEDHPHAAISRRYWRRVGRSGRSGIWHETYLVRDGEYEAVYANMPTTGLATVGGPVRTREGSTARSRLRRPRSRLAPPESSAT